MQARHEGISIVCPSCGKRMADPRIDRSMIEFRATRAPVCRLNVETRPIDEVGFDDPEEVSSDEFGSIWAGWLVD